MQQEPESSGALLLGCIPQSFTWSILACDFRHLNSFCCRSQEAGNSEIQGLRDKIESVRLRASELAAELQDKDSDIKSLQTEKELQSGGEVKELSQKTDELSKR